MTQMKIRVAGLFALLSMFMVGEAAAAVCTSKATGNWNVAATWNCTAGTVPAAGDTVIIASPHTVSLNNANRSAGSLTIDPGATLNDNGQDLTVSGSVTINGTYDGTGNNGNLIMTGNGQTLSGTGTIIDIGRIQVDANITIPAGSNLNLTLRSEIRVGDLNPATLTIDGAITGTAQTNGNRIIRADNNNTSNVVINGTINAPNSFVEVQAGGTVTNNGTVTLQYLDGNGDATSTWTQGANSSLTFSQSAQGWVGTFNASATGNTVTYNSPATPLTPSGNTYYNLAGTGVVCPHGFTILGSSPCAAGGPVSVTRSPGTCASDASNGSTLVWTSPTNATSNNASYATRTLNDGQVSQYLRCTGYGFAIPAGATITGITVNVERMAGTAGRLQDAAMRLVKDVAGTATIQATDRSTATFYPATEATEAHGGATDLWGGIWTPDDINLGNFGAALASQKAGAAGGATTASVDHMPITVTYTLGAGPHHIEIEHDGGGLTCSAETVTIKACADNLNPCTPYTAGANVTLTPGGQIFAIDATGINSAASVQQSTTGPVTLSAVSVPAATDATPTTCWNTATSTASCAMAFSDSGFVVTAPDHVSCNNASVTIEAVQTAPGTGRCVPAYKNATRAVNLYTAYASPVTGTMAATASVDGGTNWFAVSTASPGASTDLAFNASGTATILLNYQDAGQLTVTVTGTAPTGKAMTGSGTFVVAPAAFVFSGVTAGPIKAGKNFSATVTAMNNCATPAATPNFGKETSPESAILSFSKCQPAGTNAVNGAFVGSVGAFASGVATATLNWDEVGNGDLVATNSTYLGSSLTVTGNTSVSGTVCKDAGGNPIAGKVGSFIPDHFVTTVADGCAGCGFTYSGQPFTVAVTAMNGLATPAKTFNYDGSAKTTPNFANDVSLTDANAVATPVGKFGVSATPMGVTVNVAGDTLTVPKADFVSGVATLTSVPAYIFNVVPTAPAVVKVRAVDSVNASVSSSGFAEGTTTIRSGRIKVSNAHGSELLPLPMTATVQFWNGTFWGVSATDSVTSLTLAATYNVLNKAGSITGTTAPTPTGAATVANGILNISLSKPTGGAGSATVNPTVPGYLPLTGGLATFGVYRGSNEFIYLRENY
ncbi:MAG TPA: DUF6701 domain-containing protein [Gallionella sp.]|nr:DUF6701 domain-containing protein [Gallionella sp.]